MRRDTVQLLDFPYPYHAGLAICTDFHGADTLEKFVEFHKWLNTKSMTHYGKGLGLEIADSFWFYSSNPDIKFTYFKGMTNKQSKYAPIIRKYIKAGYIDALHTYGDFSKKDSFKRKYAINAINEMVKYNIKVPIWTNHGNNNNTQNLNDGAREHQGALKSSGSYHDDVTKTAGFKFYWLTDLTTHIGQDRKLTINEFINIDWSHPLSTFRKIIGAYVGSWNVTSANKLIYLAKLDDGRSVYAFRRFNLKPSPWKFAHLNNIDRQLDSRILESLISTRGYMIIYNHLFEGDIENNDIKALQRLSRYYYHKKILVTTTSRLLWYGFVRKSLDWHVKTVDDHVSINIDPIIMDPVFGEIRLQGNDLMGISFATKTSRNINIYLGNATIETKLVKDEKNGAAIVEIPWRPLRFEATL